MPELPEIERARRLAERVLVGRRIVRARCPRDTIVYDGTTADRVRRALTGRTVVGTGRRGKHFWIELDERPWLLLHFGMTGGFRTPDEAALKLSSSPRRPDDAWPPRFTKLHLHLDDGGELVMTNVRRLGRIRLRDDPAAEPPVSKLGFDPLLDLPGPAAFARLVTARKAPLKALLLDQSFAAGVGNWIADEVLYQARLSPTRRGTDLDATEARRLRSALKRVIDRAVAVNADKSRFPRTWLFHRRWGRNADATTARGEPIVHITVGGRTTAWVPSVQR